MSARRGLPPLETMAEPGARGPSFGRGLRCPGCDKRVGDEVVGVYRTRCPRCGRPVSLKGEGRTTITENGETYEARCERTA